MRKASLLLFIFVVVFGPLRLGAAVPDSPHKQAPEDVPAVIVSGLDAYKIKGPDEAVKAWIKGSPIEGSKDALSQANSLRQVQDFYGSYQSFDVIGTREMSPKTRILYLMMDYENGPLFAKFVVYRTEHGWILTSFNFNTKDDIIPSSVR
jgi:hypothetical protein